MDPTGPELPEPPVTPPPVGWTAPAPQVSHESWVPRPAPPPTWGYYAPPPGYPPYGAPSFPATGYPPPGYPPPGYPPGYSAPYPGYGYPSTYGAPGYPPPPGYGWPAPPRRRMPTVAIVLAILAVIAVTSALLGAVGRTPRADNASREEFAGAGSGPYAFEHVNRDGRPARFDPCSPIHYVVNARQAPAGGLALIRQGVAHLAEVTGLRFTYDGETDELPQRARGSYQPSRYGPTWAPVLIAWVPLAQSDLPRKPGTLALTSIRTAGGLGDLTLVSGQVALDAGHVLPVAFDDTESWGGVLLHELGHMVGLAHVTDPDQLMFPTTTGSRAHGDYAPGDREGLAFVGAKSGCRTVPPPSSDELGPALSLSAR